MIIVKEAGERGNKTVFSIQNHKGSLNPMKYCCFVVYLAKFLRSCTQRKRDIWKWKKPHTDHLRHWKILETRGGFEHAEGICWLKVFAKKEVKWRADRAEYSEYSKGIEEGRRMITLPVMTTTIPDGPLWLQRAATLLWDDGNTWFCSPSSRLLWSKHALAYEIDRCFWAAAQSRAVNGQSQVHLDHRRKEQSGRRNKQKEKEKLVK